jgi:hypothetical protein
MNKYVIALSSCLLVACVLVSIGLAEAESPEISSNTAPYIVFSSGGGTSGSNNMLAGLVIGQTVIGTASGGRFKIHLGFSSRPSGQIPTDIDNSDDSPLPLVFNLKPNYPNPFNPTTAIDYSIPKHGHVSLAVFNIIGQRVKTIVDGDQSAGNYTVYWDGKDEFGQPVASGIYIYRLSAENESKTRKMVLLK